VEVNVAHNDATIENVSRCF